jgi:hypothetical protein
MTLPGFPVGATWSHRWAGRLEQRTVVSEALRGNPLGDPHERPVWVQLPASYDDDPGARYPVVYVAQGYTGHVSMWANRRAYAHTLPEQVVMGQFGPGDDFRTRAGSRSGAVQALT